MVHMVRRCGPGLWPADPCGWAGTCESVALEVEGANATACRCSPGWRSPRFEWLDGGDVCSANDALLLFSWAGLTVVSAMYVVVFVPWIARAAIRRKGRARRRFVTKTLPVFGALALFAAALARKWSDFHNRFVFQDPALTTFIFLCKGSVLVAHVQSLVKFMRYLDRTAPLERSKGDSAGTGTGSGGAAAAGMTEARLRKVAIVVVLIHFAIAVVVAVKSETALRLALLAMAVSEFRLAWVTMVLIGNVTKSIRSTMVNVALPEGGDPSLHAKLLRMQAAQQLARHTFVTCSLLDCIINAAIFAWPLALAHAEAPVVLLMLGTAVGGIGNTLKTIRARGRDVGAGPGARTTNRKRGILRAVRGLAGVQRQEVRKTKSPDNRVGGGGGGARVTPACAPTSPECPAISVQTLSATTSGLSSPGPPS